MSSEEFLNSVCIAYLDGTQGFAKIEEKFDKSTEDEQHKLISRCSNALLSPMLGSLILSKDFKTNLESPISVALEKIYNANLKYQSKYERALDEMITLLNSNDVAPVLLKGASYIKSGLYSPGERVTSDIDIWINQEELPLVLSILQDNKYLQITNFYDPISTDSWYEFRHLDQTDFRNSPPYFRHHLPRIISPIFKIPIEIHLKVVNREDKSAIWFDSHIDKNMTSANADGLRYFTPSLTFELMHSFYHSFIVHKSPHTDYRHLLDFQLLLQRGMTHEKDFGSIEVNLYQIKLVADELGLSYEYSEFLRALKLVGNNKTINSFVDSLDLVAANKNKVNPMVRLKRLSQKLLKKFRNIFFRAYGPVPFYVAAYKYSRYMLFRLVFGAPQLHSFNAQFVRRLFRK